MACLPHGPDMRNRLILLEDGPYMPEIIGPDKCLKLLLQTTKWLKSLEATISG
jgi:hypothetical protein